MTKLFWWDLKKNNGKKIFNVRARGKTPIFQNGDFGTDPNLPQPIIKGKGER